MSSALQLSKLGDVSLTVTADAYARRVQVLEAAKCVDVIRSDFQQQEAVEALRGLKGLQKEVESSRSAVKAPVLDLGKRIDATAKTFLETVDAEVLRLTRLVTDHEAEQRRKAQEAERKRLEAEAEARRVEQTRLAELRRQEEEARRVEQAAATESQRLAAEERRREIEAQAQREEDEAKLRRASAPVTLEAPKPAGVSVSQPWTFEVLDVRAFAAAHPDLVEINVRRSAVLGKIREGAREMAGLRIYQETKVGVRA